VVGSKDEKNSYPDEEAARRRDDVIKRMLSTPPRPRQQKRQFAKAKERPAQIKKAAFIGQNIALRLFACALCLVAPALRAVPH
jgi:hypothetical protein